MKIRQFRNPKSEPAKPPQRTKRFQTAKYAEYAKIRKVLNKQSNFARNLRRTKRYRIIPKGHVGAFQTFPFFAYRQFVPGFGLRASFGVRPSDFLTCRLYRPRPIHQRSADAPVREFVFSHFTFLARTRGRATPCLSPFLRRFYLIAILAYA